MPSRAALLIALGLALVPGSAPWAAEPLPDAVEPRWFPVSVESREPPFNPRGLFTRVDYVPGPGASRRWRLCASLPDLRLAYMSAVAHGIEQEARRQGVALRLEDVGSFNEENQRAQLRACLADGVDALLVVAAAGGALEPLFTEALDRGVPVVDIATGSGSRSVTARIAADAVQVGQLLGRYLADRYALGTDTARVGWLPGPVDAAFAQEYDHGFREAVDASALTIARSAFTPINEVVLHRAVREMLGDEPDLSIVAGVAAAILVAMGVSDERDLGLELVSTGLNTDIVAAIEAGRVTAAVNDKPVAQGRIAVDLAVRALDERPFMAELRPRLDIVDPSNVARFDRSRAIEPAEPDADGPVSLPSPAGRQPSP